MQIWIDALVFFIECVSVLFASLTQYKLNEHTITIRSVNGNLLSIDNDFWLNPDIYVLSNPNYDPTRIGFFLNKYISYKDSWSDFF